MSSVVFSLVFSIFRMLAYIFGVVNIVFSLVEDKWIQAIFWLLFVIWIEMDDRK